MNDSCGLCKYLMTAPWHSATACAYNSVTAMEKLLYFAQEREAKLRGDVENIALIAARAELACERLGAENTKLQAEIERLNLTTVSVESTGLIVEEMFKVKADNAKLRGVVERLRERVEQIHDVCEEEIRARFGALPPEQHTKWKTAMLLVVPRNMAKAALAESADALGGK